MTTLGRGGQEHEGRKIKNSVKKGPGKWIFSCAHSHGGRYATKKEAEGHINSFRELLEFGETQNVKELRGTQVRWSDKAEARRVEMQLRLKRETSMTQRERRNIKFELERDRALLNPTAVGKRSCPDTGTSAAQPPKKLRRRHRFAT